ncbi:LOW QUALITY PROTEIN: uncharacterized protein O3Q21_000558 [Podargus strigoides]
MPGHAGLCLCVGTRGDTRGDRRVRCGGWCQAGLAPGDKGRSVVALPPCPRGGGRSRPSRRGWPLVSGAGTDRDRGRDRDGRSGTGAHRGHPAGAGLAQCQREAEEVTELMKQNFARALEREGRLCDLDSRAQDLRAMGEAFTRSTRRVAQQQQRGHRRWRLAPVAICLIALLLLLLLGLALWLLLPAPAIVTVTVTVPPVPLLVGTEPPVPQGPGETLQ